VAEDKGISSSINIIELQPTMDTVVGNFTYLNYDVSETTLVEEDNVLFMNEHGDEFPRRFASVKIYSSFANTNRSVLLNRVISGMPEVLKQPNSSGSGNVYFTQDFIDGFVRISPDNAQNEINFKRVMSDADNRTETKGILDYLKMNSSEYVPDGFQDEYEKSLVSNPDGDGAGITILDPNTNLPIATTDVPGASHNSDQYVSSYYLDSIIRRSRTSPVIWGISKRTQDLAELISKRAQSVKNDRYLSNMQSFLANQPWAGERWEFQGPDTVEIEDTLAREGIYFLHLGWHVLKYVKEEDNYSYLSSFLVPNIHGAAATDGDGTHSVFKDPYVLYGQTYRYEIRDAWLTFYDYNSQNQTADGVVILGTQTTNMEIDCREKLPPLQPSGFSFEYIGNDLIRIFWKKELKLTGLADFWNNEQGRPSPMETDDVGGYLLFIRNSLEEPYRLENQFHITKKYRKFYKTDFQDEVILDSTKSEEDLGMDLTKLIMPNIIGASVPNGSIIPILDHKSNSYDMEIRANQDYYITFCTYDVHGNVSNYSEQFFLRRNNVTGEVSIKLISSKGASLAYPNALVDNKFVLSSMKSSGYKYLDIHQTPDLSSSYPSDGGVTIQLIDLETEEDRNITGISSST
jgi:hypothetical protein